MNLHTIASEGHNMHDVSLVFSMTPKRKLTRGKNRWESETWWESETRWESERGWIQCTLFTGFARKAASVITCT